MSKPRSTMRLEDTPIFKEKRWPTRCHYCRALKGQQCETRLGKPTSTHAGRYQYKVGYPQQWETIEGLKQQALRETARELAQNQN